MAFGPSKKVVMPPIVHAVGGSVGSSLALFLMYPLERIRIELQVLAAHDGNNNTASRPFSLTAVGATFMQLWERGEVYRGVGPIVMTLATTNFVFFFANNWMKKFLPKRTTTASARRFLPESLWSFVTSSLAGILTVLVTNPLWVSNLRIVTGGETYGSSSLIRVLVLILQEEGLGQLWKGTYISIILVSNPVIQFFVYEQMKQFQLRLLSRDNNDNNNNSGTLSPVRAFFTGAAAKSVATLVTYPLQLTQTILRMQGSGNGSTTVPYKGVWDCLVRIYLRDGLFGLFAGMQAKLLQTVLTAAFTFLSYEQILRLVYGLLTWMHLSERQHKQKAA